MNTHPVVELHGFHYQTKDRKFELYIDQHVFAGPGLIAILGKSGSGKSTLLSFVAAQNQESYAGSLKVFGQEWRDLVHGKDKHLQDHRRKIGFVPQKYGLVQEWTVERTLQQALEDAGVHQKERSNRIVTALTEMGIAEHRDKEVSKLSGGQQQRVAIARVLARRTPLVVADEPTANLDDETIGDVMRALRRQSANALVLVITHNPSVAKECGQTVSLEQIKRPPPRGVAVNTSRGGRSSRRAIVFVMILAAMLVAFGFWMKGHRDESDALTVGINPTVTSEGMYAVPTWTPLSLATEAPTWTPLSLESADDVSIPTAPPDFPIGPAEANPGSTSPPIQPIGPEDEPTAET